MKNVGENTTDEQMTKFPSIYWISQSHSTQLWRICWMRIVCAADLIYVSCALCYGSRLKWFIFIQLRHSLFHLFLTLTCMWSALSPCHQPSPSQHFCQATALMTIMTIALSHFSVDGLLIFSRGSPDTNPKRVSKIWCAAMRCSQRVQIKWLP